MSTDPKQNSFPIPPDSDQNGGPAPGETSSRGRTERIAALEAELAEMRDRWMRAEAEMANVRARAQREVDETRQYAVQKFAEDVVEAAENLRRGLESLPPAAGGRAGDRDPLARGPRRRRAQLLGLLERNGIRREDPIGSPFDPNLHQAMAEQESAPPTRPAP